MTRHPSSGVKLFTTGGTLATRTDLLAGVSKPSMGPAEVVSLLSGCCEVEAAELDRRPSWALTLEDMQRIGRAVRQEAAVPGRRGIVVTVGTSALEYVSYATDLMLDTKVPVVFTGAMRRADEPDPDGPRNLADAIAVASSPDSRDRGVLACFASRIMSARGVWKAHREDIDAFRDLHGDLGSVIDGRIRYDRDTIRHEALVGDIDTSVEMVKAYPGAPGMLLDAMLRRGARGAVIEAAPGAGGVPPTMHEALERLVRSGVLVAVSSRAPCGRVPDPPTGGTGSPLRDLAVLSVGDLTTEKAWVLLSMALGQCADLDSARNLFAAMVRAAS